MGAIRMTIAAIDRILDHLPRQFNVFQLGNACSNRFSILPAQEDTVRLNPEDIFPLAHTSNIFSFSAMMNWCQTRYEVAPVVRFVPIDGFLFRTTLDRLCQEIGEFVFCVRESEEKVRSVCVSELGETWYSPVVVQLRQKLVQRSCHICSNTLVHHF